MEGRSRPKRLTAAAQDGLLRNPYHGTGQFGGRPEWAHTWFHGTKGEPDFGVRRKYSDEARRADLPPDQREMTSGWTQPNQHLGIHFTPLHEVAHKFVGSVSSTPGSLVHARLHFSNPAVFDSEEHLDVAVAHWASQHYPNWHDDKLNANMSWNYGDSEGTHRDFSQVPEDPSARYRLRQRAQGLLTHHWHMPEILRGFTQDLRDQGHHGIIYGNSLEGPYETDATRGGDASMKYIKKRENWPRGNPYSFSAIARPEDISVTRVEHIAPWREEPQGDQRTWEEASDQDEPDEMRDKVLDWHRQHGGKLPFRLAATVVAAVGETHGSSYGWDEDETYLLNHPEYAEDPPSASDEYWNPSHLYHGTSVELKPGDMVEGGHPSNFDKPRGYLPYGYATPHVSTAAGYAETAARRRGGRPRVYEVDRAHDMLPDPEQGAAFGVSSETHQHPDWRSKAGFRVLRELHPSEFEHHLTEDWPGLGEHTASRHEPSPGVFAPVEKNAAWTPNAGIFGATTGLDRRLFDEQGRLRPDVRHCVMDRLDRCVRVDTGLTGSDWQRWVKIYLVGGSASEWAGARPNDIAQDLDVLAVVDYDEARRMSSAFSRMDDEQIRVAFNAAFRAAFNINGWVPSFGGTWDLTGYVN